MKKLLAMLLLAATMLCLVIPAALAASPPQITQNPASLCYNEYAYALYSVDAKGSNLKYKWYLIDTNGKTYEVGKDHGDWEDGAVGGYGLFMDRKTLYFQGISTDLYGCFVYCEVSNSAGSVQSTMATILVDDTAGMPPAPEIKAPGNLTVQQGDSLTLECSVSTGNVSESGGPWLEYVWQKIKGNALVGGSETVRKSNGITSKTTFTCDVDTSEPGTFYYVCSVQDGQEGTYRNRSYSPIVQIIVEEKEEVVDLEITRKPDKKVYELGEYCDLAGIKVRVYTNMGFYDTNKANLFEVTPAQFTTAGEQEVTIRLDKGKATFKVTVNPGEEPVPEFHIDKQPESVTVNEGETATFECACNVTADYVWGMITPDGTTTYLIDDAKFPVSGVKTQKLTVNADASLDGAVFFCSIYPEGKSVQYTSQAILHVIAKAPVDPDPVKPEPGKPDKKEFDIPLPWIITGVLGVVVIVLLAMLLSKGRKEKAKPEEARPEQKPEETEPEQKPEE